MEPAVDAVIVLGIETATELVSVAVGGNQGVLALFEVARGRQHAELLTPAIQTVLRAADVEMREVGVVAVDVGPGLFTGMRVGIAAAKAVAQALRVPMIGIPSLDLLAFPFRNTDRDIVAVVDARRGQLFSAVYRAVPGGVQRVSEPAVGSVDDLVADLLARGGDAICVGDGAVRHRDELTSGVGCEVADHWQAHPSAAPLVRLAHARALREEWVTPGALAPLYLRAPDAQINWEIREGSVR